MGRLRNTRHEIVAQELSIGKSPVEASRVAGFPPGSSFAPNARKRAQRPDIRARVAELQRPEMPEMVQAESVVAVTRELMIARLLRIAGLETLDDARRLATAAPELIAAVERGKLTVAAGAQAAKLAPDVQRRIAKLAEAGEANMVCTPAAPGLE